MEYKYATKPVIIEAIQFTGTNFSDIRNFIGQLSTDAELTIVDNGIIINTLEGKHLVKVTDYIIIGVKGELYPCREDIFKLTYDKLKEKEEK